MGRINFIPPMRNKVLVFFANAPASVRRMLSRAPASEDYDARWVANEREVLELAQDQHPVLLLLGFTRPLKRTLNFLEQLQAVNAFAPVILITEQRTEFDRAVAGHVTALMPKPFEVSLLLQKIREVLNPLPETAAVDQPATPISRAND
jgi:DNA-binding response OmpR family regulator